MKANVADFYGLYFNDYLDPKKHAPHAEDRAMQVQCGVSMGGIFTLTGINRIPCDSIVTLEEVRPNGSAPGDRTQIVGTVTYVPLTGAAAAKTTAGASATAAPLTGEAAAKTTAGASATAAPSPATATATGDAATATPPRKKMKAPDATRCSTRSTVIAKRQAMASLENQRAATDSNNDLDLALNLDLDLDRDLDSPIATASSATALETVVPGRAEPAAPSCTAWSPPEAPNLKKYPMSYLPAHPDWFLCLTCKGGHHQIQDLQCMKCDEKHGKLNKRPAEHRALYFVCL
jgi:hypothetical protein